MIHRFLTHLLIVSLLYFNLAAILLACHIRFPSLSSTIYRPLPNHWITERLFRLFDVFDRHGTHNYGYTAMGMRQRLPYSPAKPLRTMVDLNIYQYFPQTLGEANRRAMLFSYLDDPPRRKKGYHRMADTIQRLYNRANPHDPVAQVFIYQEQWPKSKEAYLYHYPSRTSRLLGHN